MSGAERCDEVLRLIDEVLGDVATPSCTGRSEPKSTPVTDG